MAINRGEADLDMPPPDLAKTLMPAKSGTKNPFHNPDSNSSSRTSKSSINSTPPPTPTPTPYPYLPPPYPLYMNSSGPPQPQTPTSTGNGLLNGITFVAMNSLNNTVVYEP
jgi:hypothetical protein